MVPLGRDGGLVGHPGFPCSGLSAPGSGAARALRLCGVAAAGVRAAAAWPARSGAGPLLGAVWCPLAPSPVGALLLGCGAAQSAATVEAPRRPSGRRPPSARTAEASWHRRARRQRQQARAFVALDRARRVLSAHHGGGVSSNAEFALPSVPFRDDFADMLYGKGGGFTNWDCHICGKPDNHGSRTRCRQCEAYPKPGARRPLGGGKGAGGKKGGGGKLGNGITMAHAGGKNSAHLGDFAEKQLQAQRAHQAQAAYKANEKLLQDQRRRNDALLEQNRKLLREVAEAKNKKDIGDDDEDMEEGPEELSAEDRRARIEKIRASLPYLEENFGPESELFKGAQDELEYHNKAIREAKPYKTHRTILERKVERLKRQQDKDREHLSELREAAEEIAGKITTTIAAIADRDRELESAESELKELLLRAVGEEGPGGATQPAIDPSQGWDSVVHAVTQLTRQPGVPPEVAGQLDGLFGQLRSMVAVLQTHATAIGAVPSAAADAAATTAAAAATAQPAATTTAMATSTSASSASSSHITSPEEHRRRQRLARAQKKQTEAIAEFENSYRRQQLVNAELDRTAGGQDDVTNPPSCPPPQAATPLALPAPAEHNGDGARGAGGASNDAQAALAAVDVGGGGTAPSCDGNGGEPAQLQGAAAGSSGFGNDDGDDESDITGTLSDGERESMEIDEVVAKIPQEQRDGIRAMLERSRAKRARRLQRRLKKPVVDGPGITRNPKK